MKKLRFTPLLFRRVHKWAGLVIGIQFILWAVSGTAMALLDSAEVAGRAAPSPQVIGNAAETLLPPARLGIGTGTDALQLRMLAGKAVYEVRSKGSVRLLDAATGADVTVNAILARSVARTANGSEITSVTRMAEPNLESRDFSGPVWRVNFSDEVNSSVYISAITGELLVSRGDTWRIWDFFWMLHNMDYAERASFNHPLIIAAGFGVLFVSTTGFYLLFKSFRRREFRWVPFMKDDRKRIVTR
ncbi:PepSY domain-containing protein [Pacificimonas flava]|uniref:PepSY-associated TM helix n=1 Tax=Pacificimonas flava TaxID=1234595 RepID=M2SDF0_9SPHN|nr:PepSY domain-containing protein [Pacificimonas flava]EMD83370.1 hypothetical protein C725_1271 [Pacificimonas flava]MBB5279068.1 putative iron-regulated membrane protein [Pacificimonas flava]